MAQRLRRGDYIGLRKLYLARPNTKICANVRQCDDDVRKARPLTMNAGRFTTMGCWALTTLGCWTLQCRAREPSGDNGFWSCAAERTADLASVEDVLTQLEAENMFTGRIVSHARQLSERLRAR